MTTTSTPVDLTQFYGTYRGFAPTDESPIAMGELEVIVDQSGLKIRMATGLKIESDEVPVSYLRSMSLDELRAEYAAGSKVPETLVGFRVGDGVRLMFAPDAVGEDGLGLLVVGNEMADVLGPTFCFSPKQIAAGVYQKTIEHIRASYGGDNCFPTLANGGKTQ